MIIPNLERIATALEGLEETIIARLIDWTLFRWDLIVYLLGQSLLWRTT